MRKREIKAKTAARTNCIQKSLYMYTETTRDGWAMNANHAMNHSVEVSDVAVKVIGLLPILSKEKFRITFNTTI